MKRHKNAIVSVTNDLYTDQRVHKICLFLQKQGYNVLLVGRIRKSSLDMDTRPYKTKRMRLFFEKGAFFYAEYNLRLFLLLLFKKSTILVSNDLDTLLANYFTHIIKPATKLVYDSHEYFTEVPELVCRPKVKRIWEKIEGFIFPKLKYIYTVNDSIASLYKEKYQKDLYVVRNISPTWHEENSMKSKSELGLPENKKIIIIQGAGINIDRGAEEAVEAMQFIENAILLIVGDGDVLPYLKSYVNKHQLSDKVIFVGKKPYFEMMNYTFHSDIGLTLDKPTNINYKNSLPNKLFDYIHAFTPIICTNIFEVQRVVKHYSIGLIIEDFNTKTLVQTINSLLENENLLNEMKLNCAKAKQIENWENEVMKLSEIYPEI